MNRSCSGTSERRIGILHPADPAGYVPSGIDSFIRGILRWAPADLDYVVVGATSDPVARPIGRELALDLAGREATFVPLVRMDADANRGFVPLSVRYLSALRSYVRRGGLQSCQVLDLHRIEPVFALRGDPRQRNVTIHQDMTVIRNKDSDILWRHWPALYESLEHRAFQQVDRVFSVRRSAVKRYQEAYPQLAHKFAFLPTWVDPEVFHPAASEGDRSEIRRRIRVQLGAEPDAQLILFVGRLDRQKDPMLLLNGFHNASVRNRHLHLAAVGDGVLRPQLEELIRALGMANKVSLLGSRRPQEITELLQAGDLFVLSSAYEGMPFAVLEALATGMPVVATDVGEVGLVVKDGVNGGICSVRSAEALGEAMVSTLARLDDFRGKPCIGAVELYHPRNVLAPVYENHRRQIQERAIR